MKRVILKPGREASVLRQHPWIFSGAIATLPSCEKGEILPIYSSTEQFLGQGYFHADNSLIGRILSFDNNPIEQVLEKKIDQALTLRRSLFNFEMTNCFRLINGEGDGIPGLIADLYGDILVLQINTWGIERLKSFFVETLKKKLPLKGIYEKSLSTSRLQEGLDESHGVLFGECGEEVIVKENGMQFRVSFARGQKTGFFLDQREMRNLVQHIAKGKRVFNGFAYSGGFSLFALKGGAIHATSVDSSEEACVLSRENTAINGFSASEHTVIEGDVFESLKNKSFDYDLVILDPPAFAKKQADVRSASQHYKELNMLALQRMKKGSILLTCSCSAHISSDLFQSLIFQAAMQVNKEVKVLSRHIQALDHPISVFHPEGEYLKSLLLYLS